MAGGEGVVSAIYALGFIVGGGVSLLVAFGAGGSWGHKLATKEAVKRNLGHYVSDKDGGPEFKWGPKP